MSQPVAPLQPLGNPAETYERFFVPAMFVPWTGELLRRAAPRPDERALDVACGTGVVARHVAPLVGPTGRVVGIDLSPAMLAVARALPAPEGATIEWREGDATALPFADGEFNLALCQQGLQFVPDRAAAARELRRVLARGGRAVVAVWRGFEHNPFFREFNGAMARRLGSRGPLAPFSLGEEGELRGLLEGAGFGDVAIEATALTLRFPSADDFLRLSVLAVAAVIPDLARLDEAGRAALVADIEREAGDALRVHREGDNLAVPIAAHLAVARA